ncbi:MAG: cysteine synthase [Euryarchaeota archaeon RBG_16_68_12]|nr:MAG: cysteine synthase [Euryarchaeota archaeon RBG_16_68_12]
MSSREPPRAARDVASLIGGTPLIRLSRVTRDVAGVTVYAKAEWQNPGGSVKDRAALGMVRAAEASGALAPGKRILDATSGNTGIALAMLGAARGIGVTLCVPSNASDARKRILRAYGAELVLTDPFSGTDGAQRRAKELVAEHPELYVYLDQYNNEANWRAHHDTTAGEILEQMRGPFTHFVAGLGTTGTLVGVARRLREALPDVRVVAVQPDGPLHGLEGLKHLETALLPGIWDPAAADEHVFVSTEVAQAYVRRLAREEGLLVGTSSGAALAASLEVASRIEQGTVVTIFPDGGDKYLEERYWEVP